MSWAPVAGVGVGASEDSGDVEEWGLFHGGPGGTPSGISIRQRELVAVGGKWRRERFGSRDPRDQDSFPSFRSSSFSGPSLDW